MLPTNRSLALLATQRAENGDVPLEIPGEGCGQAITAAGVFHPRRRLTAASDGRWAARFAGFLVTGAAGHQ